MPNDLDPLFDEIGRKLFDSQAKEIIHLRRKNDQRDTGCEPDDHRIWDEFEQRPHSREAHNHEQYAGDKGCNDEPFVTVFLDDAVNDHDESAGRSTDLNPGTTQNGDHETCDYSCIKTLFGFDARGDGESNGKRKRDNADRKSAHQVTLKLLERIAFF